MPNDDKEVDRLYQLPLADFTAARNTLAKQAGRSAEIKTLVKPPVAAWAVNQIYWREQKTYDSLIEAARDLRQVHKSILAGKKGDLRTTGKLHEEAVEAAAKAALEILKKDGQPATDATKQAIVTTLRALPSSDPPGRLTKTLQPGGFEMLAGIPVKDAPAPRPAKPDKATQAEKPAARVDAAAAAKAREAAAEAARAVRLAEHTVRREEFEAARAAREAEKAMREVEAAREGLDEAKRAFEEAEERAETTAKNRKAAEKRASEAEQELEEARRRQREADRRATR